MPWQYHQRTGQLIYNNVNVATGYSGAGVGKNNPALEQMRNVGPIPKGNYRIGRPRNSQDHGPHVMDLIPVGHNAFGRTHFLIHGDSINNSGQASQGCVILPRNIRERISHSADNNLTVLE